MKQMMMLERADVEALRRGETVTVAVGGATLVIGYEGGRARGGRASAEEREERLPPRARAPRDPRVVKIGRVWKYPDALRRQIVADALALGPMEAARKHKVPWRQVYVWRKQFKKGGR